MIALVLWEPFIRHLPAGRATDAVLHVVGKEKNREGSRRGERKPKLSKPRTSWTESDRDRGRQGE
jgi:hypothetical protein